MAIANSVLDVQKEYFSLIDKHLSGNLRELWQAFGGVFSPDRETVKPYDWCQLLARHADKATLFVPSPMDSTHLINSLSLYIFQLVDEVSAFWERVDKDQRNWLRDSQSSIYYVPCGHIEDEPFVRSGVVYFDLIAFEDPLLVVRSMFNEAEAWRKTEVTSGSLLHAGLSWDIKIVMALFELWWILRYRSSWPQSSDDLRFVVAGTNWEPALPNHESLALRFMSEIAQVEITGLEDLVNRDLSIPWLEIAEQNAIIKAACTPKTPSSEESSVLHRVDVELARSGYELNELRQLPQDSYVAFGLFKFVAKDLYHLLRNGWRASVSFGADSAVDAQFWPEQVWLMRLLSGGDLPERVVSAGELGSLTLQSNDLAFLGHITDEEISFLRTEDRLREMRALLSGEHQRLRTHIGTATSAARESGKEFLNKLDEYEKGLREAIGSRHSKGKLMLQTGKQEAGQIGLTAAFGTLGLIAAPPWSFLLTAASAIVGGQSAFGIEKIARQEMRNEEAKIAALEQSPLSVCLGARHRFQGLRGDH
jgi:hypothetical protein